MIFQVCCFLSALIVVLPIIVLVGFLCNFIKLSYLLSYIVMQVARCTKIINPGADDSKYVINVKQIAKVMNG
jgi:hypothetical protein